jgi:hypothetical protein
MHLRSRRMEAEWHLLEQLAQANPRIITHIARLPEEFHLVLRESPAYVQKGRERWIEREHSVRYVYPRYYPTLPLEAYFVCPIVHMNADPATGFVCLWQQYRPTQTIVDAILITRTLMAWKTANRDPAHCMQSIEYGELPGMQPLVVPEVCRPVLRYRKGRQRLSSEPDDQASQESNCAFSHFE